MRKGKAKSKNEQKMRKTIHKGKGERGASALREATAR